MELNHQISRDASRALEEFSEEFFGALTLAPVEPWAATLGHSAVSSAPRTTYPIPLDQAGFKHLRDDIKFRRLYSNSLSLTPKKFFDGVEEFAEVLEAPDFVDWAGAPGRIAQEWLRLPNQLISALLAQGSYAGPLLDVYRNKETGDPSTRRLFAADHPCDLIGSNVTFDNTVQATVAEITSGALNEYLIQHFANVPGPNGQKLGLTFAGGTFLIPPKRLEVFRKLLEFDTLIQTVARGTDGIAAAPMRNEYKGTVSYVVGSELGTIVDAQGHFVYSNDPDVDNYVYAIAANAPAPWVTVGHGSPEELMHDKSSSKYLTTLKVGVAYHGNMAAACALPQGIVRVEITD